MAVVITPSTPASVAPASLQPDETDEPRLEVTCDTEPGDLWVIYKQHNVPTAAAYYIYAGPCQSSLSGPSSQVVDRLSSQLSACIYILNI